VTVGDETDIVKCQWCDTMLEWTQGGKRWQFTAHTDEFCRDATRQLVRDLRAALASQRATWEHRIAREHRAIDQILRDAGLPTLKERAEAAELKRLVSALPTMAPEWLTDPKREP